MSSEPRARVDAGKGSLREGCGAASAREFVRFLDTSIKSASETAYHLLSARDRRAIRHARWRQLSSEAVAIRRMTYS
ncbi:MAG: four helix bundle protein [Deltaproteobacteria bacterium]